MVYTPETAETGKVTIPAHQTRPATPEPAVPAAVPPDIPAPTPVDPFALQADHLKVALAAEPDRDEASSLLTEHLHNVARQFADERINVTLVKATVTISGRDRQIMPGDYLELRNSGTKANEKPVLCKCTGVGEYMHRRKIQEWTDGTWGKEHVVFHDQEKEYRVVREDVARTLEPEAFVSEVQGKADHKLKKVGDAPASGTLANGGSKRRYP